MLSDYVVKYHTLKDDISKCKTCVRYIQEDQ